MVRVLLSLEEEPENEVAIVSLGILVHSAVVGTVWSVLDAQVLELSGCRSSDVDHGHGHKELLGLGLIQSTLLAVPPRTFYEEPMDVLPLLRRLPHPLLIVRQDIGVTDNIVECPLILLVLPRHFLPHSCQEALCIGEACEPVHLHDLSAILQPGVQHRMSVEEASEPAANVRQQPRNLCSTRVVSPFPWHPCVENGVQVLQQIWSHHHSAIDSHGKTGQVYPHDLDDVLQSLKLLEEEDVQRSEEALLVGARRASQLHDLCSEHLFDEVGRHLADKVQGLLLDDLIHGLAAASACVLWLRLDDRRNHLRGLLQPVGEICIGVQAKDQW
mmetsp:Transcript_9482/g.21174  ORF Transcript_9482/g.21174 Transcript_9482/m.21174 type:complete len:329 (-) Transcript_9482:1558-2544(-)